MNISHKIPETEKDWLFGHLVCPCQCRTVPHGTFKGNKACRINDYLTFYYGSQWRYCTACQSVFSCVHQTNFSTSLFTTTQKCCLPLYKKTDLQHLSPDLQREILFFNLDWIYLLKEENILQILESETFLKNKCNRAKSKESSLFYSYWFLCPLRTKESESNHSWKGPPYINWSKFPPKVSPGLTASTCSKVCPFEFQERKVNELLWQSAPSNHHPHWGEFFLSVWMQFPA